MGPLRGADLKGTWEPDKLSKNTEQFSLYYCDVRERIFLGFLFSSFYLA